MDIRNVLHGGMFLVAICAACFLVPTRSALAAKINLSQQILPVRFVYLEKDGSVDRIWSNVTEKDDGYVIKFFDKKQQEVKSNQLLLNQYQIIASKDENKVSRLDRSVHFKNKGDFWEEIDTIV